MEDQFIILASDGLWDVFESQEAVDFVTSAWLGFEQNQRESDLEHQRARRSSDRRKVRASIERRQALMSRYLVEEALRRGTLGQYDGGGRVVTVKKEQGETAV